MKHTILQTALDAPHPAARWAESAPLDPLQIDCVTVVMLRILDSTCKLSTEEQVALMAVYSVVKERNSLRFDKSIHEVIQRAMDYGDMNTSEQIHELRKQAEQEIPRAVMKHFQRYLRESLYGV